MTKRSSFKITLLKAFSRLALLNYGRKISSERAGKNFFFLIFCCFSVLQVSGQKNIPQKYHFETLKNIPTQRAVASISQDRQGFIWMGTNGLGLYKYNGLDYSPYQFEEKDSTSLSSSLIHTTYVDEQNRLWVGTQTGLDLYNRNLDNFINIPLPGEEASAGIAVHVALELINGEILAGTHQNGLIKVDPETLKTLQVPITGIDEVRNFLINTITLFDGRILIGTDKGLFEYDLEASSMTPLEFITFRGREGIKAHVQTSIVDSKGTLWLGTTKDGLYQIEDNENGRYAIEHFPFTSKRILSLLETPRHTILCGTENDGMFELDNTGKILNHYMNNKFNDNGIKSNSIWSLFCDDQERIWVGFYNNGIGVYDELYDKFIDLESNFNNQNSLQSNSVTGLLKDDKGRLWIGMDGGGIDVYDTDSGKFTHLLNNKNDIANGLDSPDVQTLFMDSKGNIWVGTWDYGIYFLKNGENTFKNYSVQNTNGGIATNRILSFSEDSNGTIWMGTFSRGIHSYDPGSKKFRIYDQEPFLRERISYSDVRRVYVDSRDNIWIGGNSGLFRLKVSDGEYHLEVLSSRFYKNAGNQSYKSMILDIYEDSSQRIWIGTEGSGLCKYDMKKDSFSWITPENGFNKVSVSTIIQDNNGAIWAAGNNGLARLDMDKETVENFSIIDGLLSNDFNNNSAFKDKNGILYFGSYEGVNYFDPKTLSIVNTNPANVYLTDLKIFNQPVIPGKKDSPLEKVISQTEKVSLKHSHSVFTIDFASIDFTRPENIQFAYFLEGFENTWNYVGNTRSATYTNLPAGNYTFKVKATNNDGLWEVEPVTLDITILRPWWLTNLALFTYLLILLGAGYVLVRFVESRIKNKRILEQERARHLQEEALNDKKIQFFTNISHEFRTPLTLILSPLQDILEEETFPEKFRGKFKTIHRNTIRLKRLIDELMDFKKLQIDKIPLNISSFDPEALIHEIMDYFKEEAKQRNIVLSLESETYPGIWADRGKLEKILFNIISNAFKSTPNNGIITIAVNEKRNHFFNLIDSKTPHSGLEISIEDTGKGIPPNELGKIFNRFYQIKDRNEQYYSGTGIGLEVVKSFVELHRGDMEVESELGVGTKFRIILPVDKDQYDISEIQETALPQLQKKHEIQEAPRTDENKETHRKTLLIIEDNTELRTYLKQELISEYRVILAENGQEGLEKAKKYIPDAVITDVIMPVMDGYEFCSLLKKDIKTSHIPVLMLTAKAQTDDWVEGFEAGADIYVNKPFEMKIMRSQLKQLVANRSRLYSRYMEDINKTEIEPNSTSLDQQFILEIIRYTHENIKETNLNVEKLAGEFNLSRSQLYRKIKTLTGLTANELIRKIRLERAKELLEENSAPSVSEISYYVGFSSPSYFSKCFKAHFGVLPKEIKDE